MLAMKEADPPWEMNNSQPSLKRKLDKPTIKRGGQSEINEPPRPKRGRPRRSEVGPPTRSGLEETQIVSVNDRGDVQSEVLKLSDLFICEECEAMFRTADRLLSHSHLHNLQKAILNLDGSYLRQNVDVDEPSLSAAKYQKVTKQSRNVIGQSRPQKCSIPPPLNTLNRSSVDVSTTKVNNFPIAKVVSRRINTICLKLEVSSHSEPTEVSDVFHSAVHSNGRGDGHHIPDNSVANNSVVFYNSSPKPEQTHKDELSNLAAQQSSKSIVRRKLSTKVEGIVKLDEKYPCQDCGRTFSQSTHLSVHNRVHTGERPFKCHRCGYSFNVRSNLVVHLQRKVCLRGHKVAKKGDVVAKVDKDACGKEGDDSGIGGTEEGAGDEGGNDDDGDNDGGIIAPGDDYCMESRSINIVLNSGDEGKWDENVVNAITRDLGQKIVTTQNAPVVQSQQSAVPKRWSCQHCGRLFLCAAHVKVHERVHTGVRPYVCVECSRPFSVASNLRVHMRAKHPDINVSNVSYFSKHKIKIGKHSEACIGEGPLAGDTSAFPDKTIDSKYSTTTPVTGLTTFTKPYICCLCRATFEHPDTVRRHFGRHLGAPSPRVSFICAICDQKCASNANLETHTRMHTRERPFTCDICGRSFAQSSHVRSHLRTHGEAADRKDYVCDQCGASYRRNYALKRHQNSSHPTDGTDARCEICDCVVGSKCNRVKHMNIFHGARPFVCMLCGRGYDTALKLVEHEVRHAVPKSHACDWCDKRYSFLGDLRKHCRQYHHISVAVTSAPSTVCAVQHITKLENNVEDRNEMK